ncbi:MAG: hypothetical protein ACTSRZ_02240 [Promethearchaeota archaeon]
MVFVNKIDSIKFSMTLQGIGIDFFRIPWLEVNIYIFLGLLLLVILILILRFIFRWHSVKASNLMYMKFYLNFPVLNVPDRPNKLKLRAYAIKPIDKDKNSKNTIILVITPFFTTLVATEKRFTFFTSALAQQNIEIITISFKKILQFLRKAKINNVQSFFYNLIEQTKPDCIIGFDFLPLILNNSNNAVENENINNFKQNSEIINNYKPLIAILRPIMVENDFSLLKAIPFSYKWFYILFAKIWLLFHRCNKYTHQINHWKTAATDEAFLFLDFLKFLKFYFKKSLIISCLKKEKRLNLNESTSKFCKYCYLDSKFNLSHFETIAFGLVLDFISETSS